MTTACSSEPISYLRLERYLLHELSLVERKRIERHLAECGACRLCFERLESDRIELPALALVNRDAPAGRRRRRGVWSLAAAGAAAAAVGVFGIRSLDEPSLPRARVAVKGGELAMELIREHDGSIAPDPTRFAPGDRFELQVTCPPGDARHWDVVVFQGAAAFFPIAPRAPLLCGNAVVLPGAFRLSGAEPADVCVALGADGPIDRERLRQKGRSALTQASVCTAVTPELPR